MSRVSPILFLISTLILGVWSASAQDNVMVSLGDLPSGESVVITFEAAVNSPFPDGVPQVSAQGTVTGGNISPELTDDPGTGAPDDPTVTLVLTPNITVDPASVEFGLWDIDDGALPVLLTLRNDGTGTLNLSSVTLAGANSPEFILLGDPASPEQLGVAASREVIVKFDPEVLNQLTGGLVFTSDDHDEPTFTVVLDGFGFQTTGELVDTLITVLGDPASLERVDVNEDGEFDAADIVINVNVIDNP